MFVLEKLSEKARQRNPDEFYHKMINAEIRVRPTYFVLTFLLQDGEHHTIKKGGKDVEKRRKLEENQDISLVALKQTIEKKKAEKIQNNLHLLDMPKTNQHIFFVNDPKEVKAKEVLKDDDEEEFEDEIPKAKKHESEKEKYIEQIKATQSENKIQYKKLADAMIKEQQLSRVQEALILDKHLKSKGKKRKLQDDSGKVFFKWFNERKK